MELVIGIIAGSILGIFFSLIPGFNIGFAWLAAPLLPGEPRFVVGLIIGIDLTTSTLKHLHLLNSKHRDDLDEDITNSTNKQQLCTTSFFSYYLTKIVVSIATIFMMLVGALDTFDWGIHTRGLTVVVGVGIWLTIIQMSRHWKIATIAFVMYGVFSLLTVKLPIQQPMFVLASSLFSSNFINEIRFKSEKIKLTELDFSRSSGVIPFIPGIIAGSISGMLWGLPTSVVCKIQETGLDTPATKVSRSAVADATASCIGLTLLMGLGRGRGAANQAAASFKEVFHSQEIAFVFVIIIILTQVIYSLWQPIMSTYTAIHNNTPHFIKQLGIVGTVTSLVVFSNGMFLLTSLSALMLSKMTRLAEAPRELSLSPMGILPLVSILKMW
jgi:hypothetical protein